MSELHCAGHGGVVEVLLGGSRSGHYGEKKRRWGTWGGDANNMIPRALVLV